MSDPLDLTLEIFNGVWSILAAFTAVFLTYHLITITIRREVTLREWFFDMPQSLQLCLSFLIVSVGIFVTRAPVWYWRFSTNGDMAQFGPVQPYLLQGTILGCIGLLAAIRVITRPLGKAPMLLAVSLVTFYVVWAIARH